VRPLGVDVGVAYFSWIDTDMVRGADANPLGARMRSRLKGPAARTSPLADAAAAMEAGVVSRGRLVVHPRWVRAALRLRSIFQPIVDLQSRGHMAEDDRFALEQVEAQGAAVSAPVGAGGAADRQATVNR
jgi:hypothetical protein